MPNADSTQRTGRCRAVVAIGLLALALGTTALPALQRTGQAQTAKAAQQQPGVAAVVPRPTGAASFADLTQCRAYAGQSAELSPGWQGAPMPELSRRFVRDENGAQPPRGPRAASQGSGSMVDPQGPAATTKHVETEADRATVDPAGVQTGWGPGS